MMIFNKTKIVVFLGIALPMPTYALPCPDLWLQGGSPKCTTPDAPLSIKAATGLLMGFNVPFSGFMTPTLVEDAADEVSVLFPVGAECRFLNAQGQIVAAIPAGQVKTIVGPPQVLTSAVCDPCIEQSQ